MRKETWSVVMACALGALIGGLSALDIAARFAWGRYLWVFGALLGGMVAWCVVDFKQLRAGIARSYRTSADTIAERYRGVKGWRLHKLYWKAVITSMVGIEIISISLFMLGFLGKIILDKQYLGPFFGFFLFILTVLSVIAAIVVALIALFSFSILRGYGEGALLNSIEEDMFAIKFMNPIILPFYLICAAVDLLRYGPDVVRFSASAAHFLGDAVREFGRFLVRTFIYVHSERRTICFVDATIGAVTGYFMGEALLGAVIGAILGSVNYEIVSIRWLKLIPAVRQE